jgi:hypothetical protein
MGKKEMARDDEMNARLDRMSSKLNKVHAEAVANKQAMADLRAQVEADGNMTPELAAKWDAAEGQIDAIDALTEDPEAPAEEEPAPVDPAPVDPAPVEEVPAEGGAPVTEPPADERPPAPPPPAE